MTIARVYSAGWGVGEKLTSAQQNSLDINTTYALDKRAGQGDFLASVVQATGTGRVIASVATGPDANWTFHLNGNGASGTSALIVRVPTLSAARKYTLVHSGATGGDRIFFYVEGTGPTPSGYVDIANSVGTGLFRLGRTIGAGFNDSAESDACEVLFNGSAWVLMHGAGPGMRNVEFTSTSAIEWTCPPGVFSVLLYGYGGGGGGAAGTNGNSSTNTWAPGGGGGGGSWAKWVRVAVKPGMVYEGLVGAGGSGGAASGNTGGAGGDSIFREKVSGTVLATFRGADYGAVTNAQTTSTYEDYGSGGGPVRNAFTFPRVWQSVPTGFMAEPLSMFRPPGTGGFGTTAIVPNTRGQDGTSSAEGYAGGAQGAQGVASSSYRGGGGGGGGGAGFAVGIGL